MSYAGVETLIGEDPSRDSTLRSCSIVRRHCSRERPSPDALSVPRRGIPALPVCHRLNRLVCRHWALVGRIEMEHVPELQRLLSLEEVDHRIALNLQDVTLIDRDAVKFLARCEADSIRLENCPAYIRVWIDQGKKREQCQENSNG